MARSEDTLELSALPAGFPPGSASASASASGLDLGLGDFSPLPPTTHDNGAAESQQAIITPDSPGPGQHVPRQEFSLPPVDGGRDAWLCLAGCFTLEALIWGFPFAFGVFQDYYSSHAPFAGSSSIAVIGTCALGLIYLDIPLVMSALRLWPRAGRWFPLGGLLLMCAALAASSFASGVGHLVATQGVLYGVGGSVAYGPCLLYVDEWFVRRKGLAYGIMWSGTGIAGFVLPLLLERLLGAYGFRTALRACAVALFLLAAPMARFVKPRVPPQQQQQQQQHDDTMTGQPPRRRRFRNPLRHLRFALSHTFALYQTASVAQALGFFLPGVYLPSYASAALGASPAQSALTLLLVNVASVVGCLAMGSLADRLHVSTCLLVSAAGAALGTFLLWGFASSLPVLYLFCVVWGLFSSSYSIAWPGITRQVIVAASRGQEEGLVSGGGGGSSANGVDPGMVVGMLAFGRGIGNVVSGPLSEALIRGAPWRGQAAAGYGSGYGTLIVFTGATAVVSGASFLWRRIGWI